MRGYKNKLLFDGAPLEGNLLEACVWEGCAYFDIRNIEVHKWMFEERYGKKVRTMVAVPQNRFQSVLYCADLKVVDTSEPEGLEYFICPSG